MDSWKPLMTPIKIVFIFLVAGMFFIPTGTSIYKLSDRVFEQRVVYDGSSPDDVQCQIDVANQGRKCTVSFVFDQDVTGPLLIYYELHRFYQNHRRYVNSFSSRQLMGVNIGASDSALAIACNPSSSNGTVSLNPCGLIANSFFTDIITLRDSSVAGVLMDEKGIATDADKTKFKQVDGFVAQKIIDPLTKCNDVGLPAKCKPFNDTKSGDSYLFFYPDDDSVQYLYETYPRQITPIDGVMNEHFIVWMKTAALSKFRKLYGRIHQDFRKGDTITFEVEANFEVRSFNGDKAIILSTLGPLGGKNISLGVSYIVAGCLGFVLAAVFVVKLSFNRRALGDSSLLSWPKDLTL